MAHHVAACAFVALAFLTCSLDLAILGAPVLAIAATLEG